MGLTSKLDKLKLKSSSDVEPVSQQASDANGDVDTSDIDEVDDGGKSILSGIIAQLRPGCDLTKITLPTFILEKKSMLERITNAFQTPDILLEANRTEDNLDRFLLIVKWYLSCWHIAPKAVKKPLNPILGEVFTSYWDDIPGGNTAYYISEQTSHHPPKSSYFYLIPELKIRVDGIIIPRSKFLGTSSAAIMEGWAHVTLGERDETYIVNQPNVYCRGILFGKMRTELGDHMYVKCPKTGYVADIEFKTKGFISGTYDAIEGIVKRADTSDILYTISGKWNDVMEIKNSNGEKELFYDTHNAKTWKPKVRPLAEQMDNESRKLWHPTIVGLKKRDHDLATSEKFKVENEQRLIAKKRREDGEEFQPRYFKAIDTDHPVEESVQYIIDEDIDLHEDAGTLTKKVLSVAPILPQPAS